eukprot:jgi/Tetstr1/436116/TSEL_024963.t1
MLQVSSKKRCVAFAVLLAWLAAMGVPAAGSEASCGFVPFEKTAQTLLVGALGTKGEEALFQQWGATFQTYLTATAGVTLGGRRFQLIYLDLAAVFEAAAHGCVDLLFVNPALFSCLELEYEASALTTLINFRRGFQLDRFYGVIFTRADRTDIRTLADLQDKIVEAGSLSGLGAAQLQWNELQAHGLDFLNDPAQVRFAYNQEKIVHDVIAGYADVGMVRTDLAEGMADQGLINMTDIRVINQQDDPEFPFPYSTSLAAPEWPLAALPGVPMNITEAVRTALIQMQPDNPAAIQGLYAGWRPAAPYLRMHRMLSSLNLIEDNKCVLDKDLYDTISCREDCVKLPREAFAQSCSRQAASDPRFSCPEGYDCVCRPCALLPGKQIVISVDVWHRVAAEANHKLEIDTHAHRDQMDNMDEDHGRADGYGHYPDHDMQSELAARFILQPGSKDCGKLETCAVASRFDYMSVEIQDTWAPYRTELGLANMSLVRYRWWSNNGKANDETASIGQPLAWLEVLPDEGAHFHFDIGANSVGSHILEVEYQVGSNGSFAQADGSPIIIAVQEVLCPGEYTEPAANGCKCTADAEPANGVCTPRAVASAFSRIVAAVAVPSVLLVLALALFIIYVKYKSQHNGDMAWQIKPEDLVFAEEPEILGTGSNGRVVLKAEYFGTAVAVKEMRAEARRNMTSRLSESLKPPAIKTSSLAAIAARRISLNGSGSPKPVSLQEHTPISALRAKGKRATWAGAGTSGSLQAAMAAATTSTAVHPLPITQEEPAIVDIEAPQLSMDSTSSTAQMTSSRGVSTGQHAERQPMAELREVIKALVSLRHPNITTVMGIAEGAGQPPRLVMEYMEHQSLMELLHNETVPLEPDIKQSMAEGIARGMLYLHSQSPPVAHCGLSAGNVLIDGEFRAKLSDYGLPSKRCQTKRSTAAVRYLAPELLCNKPEGPSLASDVYAMGVLLFELFTREEAFKGVPESKVRLEVANLQREEPFRPEMPASVPVGIAQIIRDCWAPLPESRPCFRAIYKRISHFTEPGRSKNLRRHSRAMHKKLDAGTRAVLYKVFPKHVVKALARGEKVAPEHHNSVTIFFSDIVGFTDISRTISPVDVMNMLDRLYVEFDNLAEREGVFKVETIGDAYMAVANLAKRQPDHALRIARFAFGAIAAANSVPVKLDDPSLGTVSIRVGFHTGPVVASVVGKLNPRYCLFGDTVNTASRMESNSAKNKIHCSEKSAKILMLQASKEVALTCRGELAIKGKGTVITYWVKPAKQRSPSLHHEVAEAWASLPGSTAEWA